MNDPEVVHLPSKLAMLVFVEQNNTYRLVRFHGTTTTIFATVINTV